MKTNKSKWLWVALVAMGLGLSGRRAEAQQPDTMTLSVTPGGITFSVQITSVNGSGYQFGTVNIAATTVSTASITVANTGGGNVSEYFGMKVSNSAPDNWAPQSGAPGTDQFRLTGELVTNQPAIGTGGFPTTDAVTGSFPANAAALYGQASTKTAVAGSKKLWLQLEMPAQLSAGTGGAQTMTLFIQGQSS
jgi:hypothetical protein